MLAGAQQEIQPVTPKRVPGRPFPKGISPNPGGKPKTPPDIKALAQTYTERAIKTLVSAMEDEGAPWSARVNAATVIIERGHGRSPITMDPEASKAIGNGLAQWLSDLGAEYQRQHTPQLVSGEVIDVPAQSVATDDERK